MKENFRDELHASTQMTITSRVYKARMLGHKRTMAAGRVVTSREMSLDEIRRVHEEVDVKSKAVHGACATVIIRASAL